MSNSINKKKQNLIDELKTIVSNPVVEAVYSDAIANVQPILLNGDKNQWVGQDIDYFVDYFDGWFDYLPSPTDGLGKIHPFTYFYLNNKTAFYFLNNFKSNALANGYTTEIYNWSVKFIIARGEFMDTKSKVSTKIIDDLIALPSTKIEDFLPPDGKKNYDTYNEFFTRILNPDKDPRPVSDLGC